MRSEQSSEAPCHSHEALATAQLHSKSTQYRYLATGQSSLNDGQSLRDVGRPSNGASVVQWPAGPHRLTPGTNSLSAAARMLYAAMRKRLSSSTRHMPVHARRCCRTSLTSAAVPSGCPSSPPCMPRHDCGRSFSRRLLPTDRIVQSGRGWPRWVGLFHADETAQ